jgi:hypothetical protein
MARPITASVRQTYHCHSHPQRLAHPTGRAVRPEHRPTESSPALLEALHVVGRSEVRDEFVAELPAATGQVLARGDREEESESGLHNEGSIRVYEHLRPLTILVLIVNLEPSSRPVHASV